jgi:hypothetical protein
MNFLTLIALKVNEISYLNLITLYMRNKIISVAFATNER